VFGTRQDAKSPYSGVIAIFSDLMKKGQTPTIFGDGRQARDFVYVADVVQALRLAADSPKAVGRVYNIGSGKSTNLLDLVKYLNEILGTKIHALHQPPRAGDVRNSQATIRRACEELGYDPVVSFRDGLARTVGV
jgi:UDP-glucose 4-epimerase